MLQIFDSLKALISPEMISKASSMLGEKDSKVSTAVSATVPSLLGALLKKGDTPQLQSTLQEAGRTNILGSIQGIFAGDTTSEHSRMGDKFLNNLLGGKTSALNSAIASTSGVSESNAGKLISLVAAVVAGFLGNKMLNNNLSLSSLLGELNKEKTAIFGAIPSEVTNKLDLSSIINNPSKAHAANRVVEAKKKNNSWITWLIVIIALLLLFLWWRSCNRRNRVVTDTNTTWVDTVRTNTPVTTTNTTNDGRTYTEVTLANGERIRVYRGGIEEELLDYLKSDDYKNATDADFRNKWFDFDNIRFEFNSPNQLMNDSENQINNMASILKQYDTAKIKIGGHADKVGSDAVNQEISDQRAEYIKSRLVQAGIAASRISTEGFGEEYAQYAATASDDLRSRDREISMRFVK